MVPLDIERDGIGVAAERRLPEVLQTAQARLLKGVVSRWAVKLVALPTTLRCLIARAWSDVRPVVPTTLNSNW